jgi:hypothetical protein
VTFQITFCIKRRATPKYRHSPTRKIKKYFGFGLAHSPAIESLWPLKPSRTDLNKEKDKCVYGKFRKVATNKSMGANILG